MHNINYLIYRLNTVYDFPMSDNYQPIFLEILYILLFLLCCCSAEFYWDHAVVLAKIHADVLFTFYFSLLCINHYSNCNDVSIIFVCKLFVLKSLNKIFVSSINRSVLARGIFKGRPFMYIRYNIGPRIDPWGTPWFRVVIFDFIESVFEIYFLPLRYELNQLSAKFLMLICLSF